VDGRFRACTESIANISTSSPNTWINFKIDFVRGHSVRTCSREMIFGSSSTSESIEQKLSLRTESSGEVTELGERTEREVGELSPYSFIG
jgi:hypothetical protein